MRDDDILWERIVRALFRPPPLSPSEAFVRRVMAALPEAEEPAVPAAPPFFRWLAPALSLAALTLVLAWPGGGGPLSAEALILANGPEERPSAWAFGAGEPGDDDLLGFVLEEP